MKHLILVINRSQVSMKLAGPLTNALNNAGYSAIILWVVRTTDTPLEVHRLSILTDTDLQAVRDMVKKFNDEHGAGSESEEKLVTLQ